MQNKLQELTDRLYQEGLAKGKEEGGRILADAARQAEDTLAKAKAEADAILEDARKQAEDLRSKVQSDIKMASAQALQATKKDVENLIITKIAGEPATKALADVPFLKEMITAVATKFNSQEAGELSLVLPESLKEELEPFVKGQLAQTLGNGIQASFSKKIAGGFNIGPKDGGYFISLTDETFKDLISEYLRPLTKKILFG